MVTSSFLCVLNYICLSRVRNCITKKKKLLFSNISEKDQSDLVEFCVSPQGKDEDFSIIASIYSSFFKKYPQAGQNCEGEGK